VVRVSFTCLAYGALPRACHAQLPLTRRAETFFTDDAVHAAVGLKRRGTIRRLIERALT
jgi:hypothetical protein